MFENLPALLSGMEGTIATMIGSFIALITGYAVNVVYGIVKAFGMKKAKAVTNQIIEEKIVIGNYNADLSEIFSLKRQNRPYRKIAKRIAKWM
ncbi:MAG: hypothetical protein EOM68_13980 [Spirochaetia bacterium]|nr:hypothetical protein [Spirochaetia bacterium]